MKNILFVLNSYPGKGGIESVTNTLVDYLHNYFCVYTLSLSEIRDVPCPCGLKKSFLFPSDNAEDNIAFYNELIERLDISVVINQGMFLHISEIIFNQKRNKKVAVISCLHGMPMYERHLFWGMPKVKSASPSTKFKWRVRMIFNRCREYNNLLMMFKEGYRRISAESVRTVLLCQEFIPTYCQYYGIPDNGKVIAIPNPLPQKYESAVPMRWEDRKNEILFVGRVCAEKRVDLLLNLWKKVKRKNGWRLVIVGDGESLQELKDLVSRQRIENVDFRGYTATPETYYKSAKFVVLTSRMEGFWMCLIEAMRYGVIPLVFNMSNGVKSVVENSGGIVVKMNDNGKFIRMLSAIVSGMVGDDRMVQAAYDKSMRYSIDKVGSKWVEMINEVSLLKEGEEEGSK